ncbi:unnamed protein product [Vicia faba]|uniref:Uncharacterized protein n=1 Tax=Vicia faba TaxID=3906 RepID=A0AAV0YG32_VICFA|nr:unnamed protein product [Vicia faba]
MHINKVPPKTKQGDITLQNLPLQDLKPDPEDSEALQAQHSASKSPVVSSYESEESGDAKLNTSSKKWDEEESRKVKSYEEKKLKENIYLIMWNLISGFLIIAPKGLEVAETSLASKRRSSAFPRIFLSFSLLSRYREDDEG